MLTLTACQADAGQGRTVVASFYPLAYAAGRIAGPEWQVIDLTPLGTEAHDVELSLDDRETISSADLVLYLGMNGFQPQVEQAIAETSVAFGIADDLRDPHLWLSPPDYLERIVAPVLQQFVQTGEPEAPYSRRFRELSEELGALDETYRAGLAGCRFRTLIVSHEAFAYMAKTYDLEQFGLAGLEPEGEPTADRIEDALRLIAEGEAGAIFYEPTEEGLRVAENLAGDAGVPALPLSTLESQPPEGDYLTVMEDNLESLREGLQCR